MKFFIDTANLQEIKTAASWGIIDGVTTNPSLIAKEGRDFQKTVKQICRIVNGPISAEVVSLESKEMIKEAKKISTWHKNIVIKVPMTPEGIKATVALNKLKIKTNVTLVFNAQQALLATKAGGTFISPFLGRIDDLGYESSIVLEEMMTIINNYNFKSEIIAASIRSINHVKMSAELGAHIATVPFNILQQMFIHPKTDEGIKKFLDDWKEVASSSSRSGAAGEGSSEA